MSDSPARFKDLCLDAVDHQALADWWCAAMGYVRQEAAGSERDDVATSDHDAGLISWDVLADPEGNEFCCFAADDQ
jgi:hypothetical protein